MTEFRIQVVVDPARVPQGARRVERALGRIEGRAVNTQKLLRDLFAFAGIGVAIRQVFEFADSFTNLQNRLRVVTDGQRELGHVTEAVLGVANRSRSSFEATAELYSRLALATRDLGRDSGELLQVTESINKAIILSGASAKEANNGLIQLAQGIASNRLGGDELRSTLEQLPVVADVIARHLGVTRGELRVLGAEGAITADVILKGFEAAREEIDARFAKTVPTLSQSFTVLRNNVIAFIGELNESTRVTRTLGDAMRFLGENLQTVVRLLVLAGAAFGALRLGPIVQRFFELQAAVKAGTVVLLGSTKAAKMKAEFDLLQAQGNVAVIDSERIKAEAVVTATAAELDQTRASLDSIQATESKVAIQALAARANLEAAQAAEAQALADRQNVALSGTLADVRTRIAILDADLAATRANTAVATEALTAAESRLAVAQGAVADTALLVTINEDRLAISHASAARAAEAQSAAEVRLAGATAASNVHANIFTRTLARIRGGLVALLRFLRSVGGIFTIFVTASAGLILFRDEIKLTSDGAATLGDLFTELGRQIGVALSTIRDAIVDVFGDLVTPIIEFIDEFDFQFRDIPLFVASVFDSVLGIAAGVLAFLGSLFLDLPDIISRGFVLGVNFVIGVFELLPRTILAIVKTIFGILGDFIKGVLNAVSSIGDAIVAIKDLRFGDARKAALAAGAAITKGFNDATSDIGGRFQDNFENNLFNGLIPRLEEPAGKTFTEIGATAAAAFQEAFGANVVTNFVLGLLGSAEDRAAERLAAEQANAAAKAEQELADSVAKTAEEFAKRTASLRLDNRVLAETIRFGETRGEQLREILTINAELAEKGLPLLEPDQKTNLRDLIARKQQLQRFQQIAEDLVPLQVKLAQRERDLRDSRDEGFLSAEQLAEGLRRLRLEAAEAGTSIRDGLTTGVAEALEDLRDLQETTSEVVTGAFESIQGAIANTIRATGEALFEFFDEGKFRAEDLADAIKGFFFDATQAILRQLEDLLAQQALLSATEFVKGFIGGGGEEESPAGAVDDAAMLAQREAVAAQEQLAAATLEKATATLGTAVPILQGGATILNTGSTTLGRTSITLKTAAATLAGAIPGLQDAATKLLAAAKLQLAANAASGGGIGGTGGGAAEGTGAALASTPILVGEEGPEIFTPGQTGSITPTDQTIEALSAGAAMTAAQAVVNVQPTPINQTVVVTLDPKEVVQRGFSDQLVIDATQRNPRAMKSSINTD